ncbi:MAG: IS110 family transposase, partial [Candidatus Rokuibacteriota bacterium]
MDVVHPTCAGLDVHQKTIVACVRILAGKTVRHHLKTFGTTTRDLLALGDWLARHDVTHVALESTGVYWKPVWYALEGQFELLLANPMHVRNIPGRKTDVNDATWIADLLAHDLVRSSFVPPEPIQELRDLTRTRKQLMRESARHVLRIQKTLDHANLKLTGLLTDILGVSGRAILDALVAGERDPERLADLVRGRVKASRAELVVALHGRLTPHLVFMLKLRLTQIDAVQAAVRDVEARVGDALVPFRAAVERLTTIRGIGPLAAAVLVADVGVDMSRFPTAGHLRSWAGLSPRHDESAGKRRSTRTLPGNLWRKTTLVQAAWSAVRKEHTYV